MQEQVSFLKSRVYNTAWLIPRRALTWCRCTWVQRLPVQRQALNNLILFLWGRPWPRSLPGCVADTSSRGLQPALWPQSLGWRAPVPQRLYLGHNASDGERQQTLLNAITVMCRTGKIIKLTPDWKCGLWWVMGGSEGGGGLCCW